MGLRRDWGGEFEIAVRIASTRRGREILPEACLAVGLRSRLLSLSLPRSRSPPKGATPVPEVELAGRGEGAAASLSTRRGGAGLHGWIQFCTFVIDPPVPMVQRMTVMVDRTDPFSLVPCRGLCLFPHGCSLLSYVRPWHRAPD